ncbi:MAG: hypothetical protein ACKVZH_13785 [Blastocatellia bacterium]
MKKTMIALAILCMLAPFAYSAKPVSDPWRFRAGIRNSVGEGKLKPAELSRLLESLRRKTGFEQMRFDEAGFLVLGDRTRFAGGSAAARELLVAAVDGRMAFDLQASNHSPAIAFAHLSAGHIQTSFKTKTRIEVREIHLDFADFAELRGERRALEAFDLGLTALHELAHGVLGLQDAVGQVAELGECDGLINQIRRELGLPERLGYSARVTRDVTGGGSNSVAELVFTLERVKEVRPETKRLYLRWDATRVASATSRHDSATRPTIMAVVR